MEVIPEHIQKYLPEAGFTSTEIIVLQFLMKGGGYTVRGLARDLKKSTGVLDQSVKKLMGKGIVKRVLVNDTPKYELSSLKTIADWVAKDMEDKWSHMKRKQEDFSSFISSVETKEVRPIIEYYEGADGVKEAYQKILYAGKEILAYFPYRSHAKGKDYLSSFHKEYTNERRKRGVFSRVITSNSPDGRKYKSRDPFEFRSTVLVSDSEFAFSFEKLIAGDMVACFSSEEEKACIIRFPQLANIERHTFEVVWGMMQSKNDESHAPDDYPATYEKIDTLFSKLVAKIYRHIPSHAWYLLRFLNLAPRVKVSSEDVIVKCLEVHAYDRPALTYEIAKPFAMRYINIIRTHSMEISSTEWLISVIAEFRSMEELSYVLDELKRVRGVTSVTIK